MHTKVKVKRKEYNMKYKGKDHLYDGKKQLLITSKKMRENESTYDIFRTLQMGVRGGKSRFIINSIKYYQEKYGETDTPCLTEIKFLVKCFNSVKHKYGIKTEKEFISFIDKVKEEDLQDVLPSAVPMHILLTFNKESESDAAIHDLLEEMSMTARILLIEKAVRAYIVDENIVNANCYMALVNKEVMKVANHYAKKKDQDFLCDIWSMMDRTDDLKVLCKATESEYTTYDLEPYEVLNVAEDIDVLLKYGK